MKRAAPILAAILLCLAAFAGGSGLSRPVSVSAPAQKLPPVPLALPAPLSSPVLSASPLPSPAPASPLPEEDYALFARVGFAGEDAGRRVCAKWTSPIRVEVQGKPGSGDSAALFSAVRKLRDVSGMPGISFVTAGGNVLIAYVPKSAGGQIDPAYNGIDSAQVFIARDGGAPASVRIVLTDELTGQSARDAALWALLFRSLGLTEDSSAGPGSVLNPAMAASTPSALDWLMLCLLYSPQVRPGMDETTAMPLVRALEPPALSGGGASPDAFTRDELLAYFNEVGFCWAGRSGDGVVSKWAAPVKAQITGDPSANQRELLEGYFSRLNAVPGFPGAAPAASGGNFVVTYEPRAQLLKAFPKTRAAEACAWKIARSRGGAITSCQIAVDDAFADPAQARTQLLRVLAWAMGLNFTSGAWPGSILNLKSGARDWANIDWEMIGLLYRTDVKVGARRGDVMNFLKNVTLDGK